MIQSGFDVLLSGTWALSLFGSFLGGNYLSEYQSQNALPLITTSSIILAAAQAQNDNSEEAIVKAREVKKPIPKADGYDEISNSSWKGFASALSFSTF